MAETFIFRKEWLDNIKNLTPATQDQILGDLARYGAGLPLLHESNPVVATYVDSQKKRIDISIAAYDEKVEMSKSAGRKGGIDKTKIYELACLGWKAKEIAKFLGCSLSTVQHSDEWKQARQEIVPSVPSGEESEEIKDKYTIFDF